MIVADQSEVVAFLSDPANWGPGIKSIERIETHGAVVFLGGERALKMKRAVLYDYMDYSTLARRRKLCEAELAINRRTAPAIYRSLCAVSRQSDGRLAIGTDGTIVEWLVEMRRFDQAQMFDRLAQSGRLTLSLAEKLADTLAKFHALAETDRQGGGAAALGAIIESNETELRRLAGSMLRHDLVEAVLERQRRAVVSLESELEARRRDGYVRRCHGDLHLGNIVAIDGQPTLFDAIEFNDSFAVIDVLYDLAFLIMDLEHRRLPVLANTVLSRYLAHQPALHGLSLMPLYLSCRATVRAKVGMELAEVKHDSTAKSGAAAADYLAYAQSCFERRPLRLVAVGGLSGTGKSTLARELAPFLDAPPGAVVLRSDVLRKCLLGRAPTDRLGAETYTAEFSARVYAELLRRAEAALAAGRSVMVDAVYARPEERTEIETVARAAGASFHGYWLEAPAALLTDRIAKRRDDASDADAAVLALQLAYDLGEMQWTRVETSGGPAAVLAKVRELLTLGR